MLSQPLWLRDLAAFSFQLAALVIAASIVLASLRLRVPKVRLAYWQLLLAASLALPLIQPWRPETVAAGAVEITLSTSQAMATTVAATRPFPWADVILAVLLGGIALRLLWVCLGLIRLRIYRRRAQPLETISAGVALRGGAANRGECHAERSEASALGSRGKSRFFASLRMTRSKILAEEMSVRNLAMRASLLDHSGISDAQRLIPVRTAVFLSRDVVSPATFGLRSPAVLFPERFLTLSPTQQRSIACHEFLHIRRRDWAWNLLEELILSLLWFHPAIWWLIRNVRLSREQTVDAETVRLTQSRKDYLEALLEIARHLRIEASAPAALFLREN